MPPELGRRAMVLLALITLLCLALLGQLARLTILERQKLVARIPVNHVQEYPVDAPRGSIFDRNGLPLAVNRPASVVYAYYPYYQDPHVQATLARILNLDPEKLADMVRRRVQQGPLWEPLRIKSDITLQEWARLLEHQADLPGVQVEVEPVRQYPQGSRAAHIVGYVGAIDSAEWERLRGQGYQPDDIIGKTGLERYYESWLRGTPGTQRVELDPHWRPVGPTQRVVEPVQGHNLYLTIDLRLQEAAERALEWTVFRINARGAHTHGAGRPEVHPAKAGALVVLDVKTGAILAMASYPTYDPNVFITRRPEAEFHRIINDREGAPLWNRAVQSRYFPGSTWKMLVAVAALTEKVVTPGETVFSGAVYEPTGQRDWLAGGHGPVNLFRALQRSSNIYFYEMGSRLGIERLERYARLFGFGQPTGVDLPGESPGFVPDAGWRRQHGWYLGNTTSAAIGQWFEVTPLQLARYVAAIANGGKVMRPYLVERIAAPDGRTVYTATPEVVSEIPAPPEVFRRVVEGMKAADAPGGTSDFVQFPLPGLVTAGKTGTAQVAGKSDYGVYVGFAPADDPQIAVAVLVEEGGHGSWVSPAARAVYAAYFQLPLRPGDPALVPPEYPERKEEIARAIRETGTYVSPSH